MEKAWMKLMLNKILTVYKLLNIMSECLSQKYYNFKPL